MARSGRTDEAESCLRELEKLRRTEYVDPYPMAFVYDALGRMEEAFSELERAVAEGSPCLFLLDVDPRMAGLRSHPRFARLRNRVFHATGAAGDVVPVYAGESAHTSPVAS